MSKWYGPKAEMGDSCQTEKPSFDTTTFFCHQETSWNESDWTTESLKRMFKADNIHPDHKGWMEKELERRRFERK